MTTNDTERDTPTRDELLAMDAGRALDAEIARLLGWQDVIFDEIADEYTGVVEGIGFLIVPRYSTDADAALTLPIPDTYEYYWYIQRDDGRWLADIPYYESVDHQTAPTAALALCRAWIDHRFSWHAGA